MSGSNQADTLFDSVSESRRSQRLPENVEDPAVLSRVAALVRGQLGREIPEGLLDPTRSGQTTAS
jgi:hypothetical protein